MSGERPQGPLRCCCSSVRKRAETERERVCEWVRSVLIQGKDKRVLASRPGTLHKWSTEKLGDCQGICTWCSRATRLEGHPHNCWSLWAFSRLEGGQKQALSGKLLFSWKGINSNCMQQISRQCMWIKKTCMMWSIQRVFFTCHMPFCPENLDCSLSSLHFPFPFVHCLAVKCVK